MNIFAIDLGNKRVKMKSDRAEYSYPASYLNSESITTGGLGGTHSNENMTYQMDKDGENTFIWGPELEIYNLPEKMIDTYARSGRMKQKKTQRLLKFALGRLAMDYRESKSKTLVVHLMLGVPITDLHQESETVSIIKDLVIGRHYIQVDGEEVRIDIPSEDYVSIIPQYMGTVLNLAFDDGMHRVETYASGRIGVLDIGGGTLLINSSNQMNPSPVGSERFEGIQILIKEIAGKVNSTKPFVIESLLRTGSVEEGYIYRPNRNEGDARDITAVISHSIERYTRFTVAPFITENFPDLEEVDLIVLTGGGSNIVSKAALIDEIGEEYYKHLVFMDGAEQANVRGFYKGARLLWEEGEQKSSERAEVRSQKVLPESQIVVSPSDKSKIDYTAQLSEVQKNLKKLQEEVDNETF